MNFTNNKLTATIIKYNHICSKLLILKLMSPSKIQKLFQSSFFYP